MMLIGTTGEDVGPIAVGVLVILLIGFGVMWFRNVASGYRRAGKDAELKAEAQASGSETKVCPDCRSDVPIDARVCRYCQYRFS